MKGWMSEFSARLHSVICGIGGHDLLLSVEPGRLRLRCTSCPYETPGWTIKENAAHPGHQPHAMLVEHTASFGV